MTADGRRVLVPGGSKKTGSGVGFATVAYAARAGARLWVRRYHGPNDRNDYPGVVLVSPRGGGTVVVAGQATGGTHGYLGVAYSLVTGRMKWVSRFAPDGLSAESLGGAALSPDGRNLYLAGLGYLVPGGQEPSSALTVAAKVATGALSWATEVTTDLPDQAGGPVAVSPDGRIVYIGVESFTTTAPPDFSTLALRS